MKRLVGLCLALALPGLLSGRAGESPVQRHGQLAVKGNRIVDKDGQPVVLRGMSLYWSQWKGQFYNLEAIKWLRDDWHCSIIRASMAVGSGGYLANPEREKQKVKTAVQAAIDLGIYVIIDWHDHNANRNSAQAQSFFEEMAGTYGRFPNVIYETWNEPLREHDWRTVVKPYHEAIIPKIRAHDPRNLIVCGSSTWSQDVDTASEDPLKFENVAYTLHFYAGTHGQALRDKAARALRNGVALMVTEWGTSEATGSGKFAVDETREWWRFMEENQLSWCNWSVADLTETSAALRPGAAAAGGWSTNILSASGILVREELRSKNPATFGQ